jgi:predicted TIM-barrel fold metal-dependent hydrolase
MTVGTPSWYDAYSHCGRSKYEPWDNVRRTHLAAKVVGGLLVQHLGESDNTYLIDSARRMGPGYRAVVLIEAERSGWRSHLRALAGEPEVVALRVMAEKRGPWVDMAHAASESGLDVIYVCPEGLAPIRDELHRVAVACPTSRHVLAHFGAVRDVPLDAAHCDALHTLGALPNVILMVSGFSMYWEYPFAASRPLMTALMEHYPEDRMVWGSNYPVRLSSSEYVRNLDVFAKDPWGIGSERLLRLLLLNGLNMWCRSDSSQANGVVQEGTGEAVSG